MATMAEDSLTQAEHEKFMRRAIELGAIGGLKERTGGCFGAVIVDKSTKQIVGEGYNHVIANNDPTWHGEIAAIREAGPKLGRPHLTGCVLYTSGQPCPMCMCSCLWARLDKVYYAATYEDVKIYGGFEDEDFMAELKKPEDQRTVPCFELLREEAVEVWKKYKELPDTVHY